MKEYNFKEIEEKWSKKWANSDYGKADDNSKRPKHYHLVEFPYPSGAGLHVGHCMGYGASDAYCRMKRMQGFNVMFPIGWDAFGLPTENYAIKNKVQPSKATSDNIAIFKKQINSLAYSFDWSREINTTDPKYYKWTQWIFLQFYTHAVVDPSMDSTFQQGPVQASSPRASSGQAGKLIEVADDDTTTPRLAYQAEMPVNWCPSCKINLANEEVIGGKCERCGEETEKRMQKQWMLSITAYADRLINDLDKVDYQEKIKTQQINWIGKSNGATIRFNLKPQTSNLKNMENDLSIEVFTTRADTLFGATFMAITPEHEIISKLKTSASASRRRDGQILNLKEVEDYVKQAKKKSDLERTDLEKDKTGVELKGIKAINPINNEEISIFVADYVLSGYGTGAVMCVPAHDQRDFEFARKYHIPVKQVIAPDITYYKTPPKDGLEWIERDAVESIVFDPKRNKYMCLEWKKMPWTCFITGGVDDKEDKIEAAKREILEETGYKNVKFIRELGKTRLRFHAAHKNCNRLGNYTGLLFELVNNERDEPSEEEKAIHEVVWLSAGEITEKRMICASYEFWMKALKKEECAFIDYGSLVDSKEFSKLESREAMKKITEKLKKLGLGDFAVNYKLRDWIFSRQHYWGEPIPIIYCAECAKKIGEKQVTSNNNQTNIAVIDGKEHMIVPLPEDQLPLELPLVDNYQPTDTGESPLAKIEDWVNTTCPKCGAAAKRETDTMPNWAGSSWYFLRYCDPKNDKQLASANKLKYWLPVDLYNGGMEHTTLHLLYSRFWHKFLYDLDKVPSSEPYKKRIAHGIILGTDGRKMSKSFGNTISPEDMIEKFGADTLRAYIMFIGPYDQESAWNMNGMQGVYRFIKKIWENFGKSSDFEAPKNIILELHKIIKYATEDIEKFSFNTYIAKLMGFNNILSKEKNISKNVLKKFAIIFAPAMPHLAEELWQKLNESKSIFDNEWPAFDQIVIKSENIEIPIQVNGKVRDRIFVSSDIKDDELKKLSLESEKIINLLKGVKTAKIIVVPKRLVSIVITKT